MRRASGGALGLPVAGVLLAAVLLAQSACSGNAGSGPPPPPADAIKPGTTLGTASITGRVLLKGPPPPREKLTITEATCGAMRTEPALTETVVANPDGTLRNVVVSVASGLGKRVFAPPEPTILDQKGCLYEPHVIAVQTNQIVTFLNSDKTLHNIHAVTKINPPFNVGMAVQGQKVNRFFSKPEMVRMKCDVHSWMQSWIGVFDNPFHAVTQDGGTFTLSGLPAGTYEIQAWQESYGTKTQSVTLSEGEAKSIEFEFGE